MAVVNKPQGMVVHPSAGHTSGTLVNALMYHIKDLSGINGVLRPGIVHRIDKDTSGLLMIAKNDDQVKKAKYTVQEGDVVTYHVPEPEVLEYVAEDLPLEIVYQDEDVAVVNKPQGMVVHPSAGHTSGTLVNALM
ncbi:pseudouridine synthase, partial [Haemophilus influenzae]|uniref:pseudouridine synthase n=1 Tax=Haemophilus influenzae TaxID=727 RepID=UPI0022B804BF